MLLWGSRGRRFKSCYPYHYRILKAGNPNGEQNPVQ
jgi:hypothetical protein